MPASQSDEIRLHIIADAIRRRWRLIVFIALAAGLLGAAFVESRSPTYESVTKVVLQPLPGNAFSLDSTSTSQVTVAMETEASLVSSPAVTRLANEGLADAVEPGSPLVSATVPPNTEIVQISFTGSSASQAKSGASAFAEAFLAYRSDAATQNIDYQLNSLQNQAKAANASLKAASTTAAQANPPPDASSKVQLYASQLASLQASIGQLQTQNTEAGSLVSPAKVPDRPSGLSPVVVLLGALLLGLALGTALAIWRERNDDQVRGDFENALDEIPVLALVPQEPDDGGPTTLNTDPPPGESFVDAYRRLRTAVLSRDRLNVTLVVSGVTDRVVADNVAANLSLSLATAGHEVVLVNATLAPSPSIDDLGPGASWGLADLLASGEVRQAPRSAVPNLQVIEAGNTSSQTRDLLSGSELEILFRRLRESADFVVVAAGAANSADGSSVALAGDLTLLVAADRLTTHDEVREVSERAGLIGVDITGAVVLQRRRLSKRKRSKSKQSKSKAVGASGVVPAKSGGEEVPTSPVEVPPVALDGSRGSSSQNFEAEETSAGRTVTVPTDEPLTDDAQGGGSSPAGSTKRRRESSKFPARFGRS